MICKICNTENLDGATFCSGCGARLDGRFECPSCGGTCAEDALFCPHCGAKLDQKETCKKCGTVFEGKFCPKCGTPVSSETPAPTEQSPKEQPAEPPKKPRNWKKILFIVGGALAMASAVLALLFSLFIGFNVSMPIELGSEQGSLGSTFIGMGGHNIFYYFYQNFKDAADMISSSPNLPLITVMGFYIKAVFGTMIALATLITVLTLTIKAATKYANYMHNGANSDFGKCAYGSCLAYFAGIVTLYALEFFSAELTYGNETVKVGLAPNGATITGIVLCSVFIACYLGFCIAIRGKKMLQKRTLCEAICSAVGAVILIVMLAFAGSASACFTPEGSTVQYGFSNLFYIIGIRGITDKKYLDFLMSVAAFVLLCIIIILVSQEAADRLRTFERNTFATLKRSIAIMVLTVIFTALAIFTVNRVAEDNSDLGSAVSLVPIITVTILAALNLARAITQTVLQKALK